MAPKLTRKVYLGRWVPDRTDINQCVFAPSDDGGGLVTIPFAVYGEERAKGIKAGYAVDRAGKVSRRVLDGLAPEATVIAQDPRGYVLAWKDPNQQVLHAVDRRGAVLWRHKLRGFGCARRTADGMLAVGSLARELRRVDRTGTMLHDFDAIFSSRPFSGPHGVDLSGSATYLADPDLSHSIWAIDNMGNPTQRLGTPDVQANRSGRGLLCYPFDVLVSSGGVIWVAEHGRHRLAAFDARGRAVAHAIAKDLQADEIGTTHLYCDWERKELMVFARVQKEIWLLGVEAA